MSGAKSVPRSLSTVSGQEDLPDARPVKWISVIFIPFNPVFRIIILVCVLVKCYMAPLEAVFRSVYCSDVMDHHPALQFVKFVYQYAGDFLYIADIFLHILHRQVSDEAMKREFLPKPAWFLALDMFSLVPLQRMLSDEACVSSITMWPNVLVLTEVLVIYRVVQYFELTTTHSGLSLITGYILVLSIMVHSTACTLLLMSDIPCIGCTHTYTDWRMVYSDLKEDPIVMYTFAFVYVASFWGRKLMHDIKPRSPLMFIVTFVFILVGWVVYYTILVPKIFAEVVLGARRLCEYHPRVRRALDEVTRRHPAPQAAARAVERYYSLMWEKRSGVLSMPPAFTALPKYMKVDITQDITWPMFYHSPNIRKTSPQFKRWLCDRVDLTYRIPGERFFTGAHCFSSMYYLKSGVVQFLSSDDAESALLSVTSGTIFGDISFLTPPHNRQVIVRCLTYCEVHSIRRREMARALHVFPADRRQLVARALDRLRHAKDLHEQKQKANLSETNPCGDESLEWLKRRWWEIRELIRRWKMQKQKHRANTRPIEMETVPYHCAKYIGQLVLSKDSELGSNVMFSKSTFPWILAHDSGMARYWRRIVKLTIVVVVLVFPPNLARAQPNEWFHFVKFFCDSIFMADILMSLATQVDTRGTAPSTFLGNCTERCKTLTFHLDFMASPYFEHLLDYFLPNNYGLTTFNRLIKVYQLLGDNLSKNWKVNPIMVIVRKIAICFFLYYYAVPYALVVALYVWPSFTQHCFFRDICAPQYLNAKPCTYDSNFLNPVLGWMIHELFTDTKSASFNDNIGIILDMSVNYVFRLVSKSYIYAILYLKYKDGFNYYKFVRNVKKYFLYNKIHPDLMNRLDRYLECHWKYYEGMEIMHPQENKSLPYEIYRKLHGEVAEMIIRECGAFDGSSNNFVRELAGELKFLMLPKGTTLLLFGSVSKNVTWLLQGCVRAEYHDDAGELVRSYLGARALLAVNSAFMDQPSIVTYTAASDCEILYIEKEHFNSVLKLHPQEWEAITRVSVDLRPIFTRILTRYVKKHRDYQRKARSRSMQARRSLGPALAAAQHLPDSSRSMTALFIFLSSYRQDPESQFILSWLAMRAVLFPIKLFIHSLHLGAGARFRDVWAWMIHYLDYLDFFEIIIKCMLPYYDERGVTITNIRMCFLHYFRRTFFLDLIAVIPFQNTLYRYLNEESALSNKDRVYFLYGCTNLLSKGYLWCGYCNYLADVPHANHTLLMLVKWMGLVISTMFAFSLHFTELCLETTFEFDDDEKIVKYTYMNDSRCFLPRHVVLTDANGHVTPDAPHLVTAHSYAVLMSAMFGIVLGGYNFTKTMRRTVICIGLSVFFWMAMFRCMALLILHGRGDLHFQLGLAQLRAFLLDERIDKQVIDRLTNYFGYWWVRTRGLDIKTLMSEKIGLVFKQDLNYFFYKKTIQALDTVLEGGETLQRDIASLASEQFYLPGEFILSEHMISHSLYIVHRGRVTVYTRGGETAALTKGCIFGQLTSRTPRPSKISVRADTHVDVLAVPTAHFHDIQTDHSRVNISRHPDARLDYLTLRKVIVENPYNTVEYLLRGQMVMQLPWSARRWSAREHAWVARWLLWTRVAGVWLGGVVAAGVLLAPPSRRAAGVAALVAIDLLHLLYVLSQYYMLELVVEKRRCVHRYIRARRLRQWQTYCDLVSFVAPLSTLFTGVWVVQLARLLRLFHVYEYYNDLRQNITTTYTPVLIKLLVTWLALHLLTFGWVYVACRTQVHLIHPPRQDPAQVTDIDMNVWSFLHTDRDEGCLAVFERDPHSGADQSLLWQLVPSVWYHDYTVGFGFIIAWFSRTSCHFTLPQTVLQGYYQILVVILIYLVEMTMASVLISAVYTKIRAIYQFDYQMLTMVSYFKHNDLSPNVMNIFYYYMRISWMRNRGTSLPLMLYQTPACLREDVFAELYLHHLRAPPVFNKLPLYFLRQLTLRLNRLVMFPGKCIVNVGDILPIIYFIHEGEVEKWAMDSAGDGQMLNVLSTCGFFGIVPGLFPSAPYQHAFYSRTMVDMVTLRYEAWQDLLTSHPDVKQTLYEEANKYKKQTYNINIFSFRPM